MGIKSTLLHVVTALVFERPVRGLDADSMRNRLIQSGDAMVSAIRTAGDITANQDTATHIIGIERWGQARLRDALNGSYTSEEYDGYRPASAPITQLADLMQTTRAETVAVLAQLVSAGIPLTTTIPHNTFGDMTVAGWLQYIQGHGAIESRKLRK